MGILDDFQRISQVLVEEHLDGPGTPDPRLRTLYTIEQIDFEWLASVEIESVMVELAEEVRVSREIGPHTWTGEGSCMVEVTLHNPSRIARAASSDIDLTVFCQRMLAVPLDYTIRFNGSDLDFEALDFKLSSMKSVPRCSELDQAAHALFARRMGVQGLWNEFKERARHLGLAFFLWERTFGVLVQDLLSEARGDPAAARAIREAYAREESEIEEAVLARFYGSEIWQAKRRSRHRHLRVIPGGRAR